MLQDTCCSNSYTPRCRQIASIKKGQQDSRDFTGERLNSVHLAAGTGSRHAAWATSIARQFLAHCSLDTPLCERFLAASEVEQPRLPSRVHQCQQASAKNNVPSQHTCNRTRKEGALQAFHHRVALGAAFRSKCQQRASISEQPNECL